MKLCDAKILFVDDEPLLLKIFGQWLAGATPSRISTASDGLEALKLLAENDYDLVITDVNMPRMDGITLVRHVSEWRKRAPSIVFLSGFGNVDEREMYGLGVQSFLSKPMSRDEFIAAAERAVADRTELWKKPWQMPPRHSLCIEALDFSESSVPHGVVVGCGGFSAPYSRAVALGKVNFECLLTTSGVRLAGQAYVRWASQVEGRIGVEFAYLEEACREPILDEINRNDPQAFIPSR